MFCSVLGWISDSPAFIHVFCPVFPLLTESTRDTDAGRQALLAVQAAPGVWRSRRQLGDLQEGLVLYSLGSKPPGLFSHLPLLSTADLWHLKGQHHPENHIPPTNTVLQARLQEVIWATANHVLPIAWLRQAKEPPSVSRSGSGQFHWLVPCSSPLSVCQVPAGCRRPSAAESWLRVELLIRAIAALLTRLCQQ